MAGTATVPFELVLKTAFGELKISGDSWPLIAGLVGTCAFTVIGAVIIISKMEEGKTAREQLQLALIERQQERNAFQYDNRFQPEYIHNDFE